LNQILVRTDANIWVRIFRFAYLDPYMAIFGFAYLGSHIWVRIFGFAYLDPNMHFSYGFSAYLGSHIWVRIFGFAYLDPNMG
jgi:hypothetical protein